MSHWIPARFRGDKVFVACEPDGTLIVDEGLVPFVYHAGGKRYRTHSDRLALEAGATPQPEAGEAEQLQRPKLQPAGRVRGAAGGPRDSEGVIAIWTDGACTGNPGPAGLGVLYVDGDTEREVSRYLGHGTNNIAELTAILVGLRQVDDASRPVDVMTDSAYCHGLLTKGWKAKANQDLVRQLRQECGRFADLRIVKVPGHSGVPENERADELARRAITGGLGDD